MAWQQTVARDETDVPVSLSFTRTPAGGVSGLTVVVAIRDGATLTSYLDFGDQTFKTAAFIARTSPLTDLVATAGAGFYALPAGALNLATITNLPVTTHHLVAEFTVSGAFGAATEDMILLHSQPYAPATELIEIWQIMGLDINNALTVSDQFRRAGAVVINQNLSINGGIVTVQRA